MQNRTGSGYRIILLPLTAPGLVYSYTEQVFTFTLIGAHNPTPREDL